MKITFFFICIFALMQPSSAQTDTIIKFYDYHWKGTSPEKAFFHSVAFKKDSIWYRFDFYTDLGKYR